MVAPEHTLSIQTVVVSRRESFRGLAIRVTLRPWHRRQRPGRREVRGYGPWALIAIGAAVWLVGCAGGAAGDRFPTAGQLATTSSSHVVTIVMENKEYGDIIGNRDAPFINRLARRYGVATDSYGISHRSLPDYLALTGGSTHAITSDCTSCHVAARNIVDQLETAQVSWKAYMQDMPEPCFAGVTANGYVKRHDPFVYYDDIAANPARCRHVVPYTQLSADLRRGRLPTYAFISPSLCDDMHDCSVATGDHFLADLVPLLLRALGRQGYLVLTWDEGTTNRGCCRGAHGGHIPTVVAGRLVRGGSRYRRPLDDYGVLGTIEDTLGLPRLALAAEPGHGHLNALFTRLPRLTARAASSRASGGRSRPAPRRSRKPSRR